MLSRNMCILSVYSKCLLCNTENFIEKKKDLGVSSYNAVIIAGPAHPSYLC